MSSIPARCSRCGEPTDSLEENNLCPVCGSLPKCARCGEPNPLAGRSPICAACVVEERDPKAAERRARRELMAELGMPAEAIWKDLSLPHAMLGAEWEEYSVDWFGMVVDHMPDPCPWPFWRYGVMGGQHAVIIQIWRQRVQTSPEPC